MNVERQRELGFAANAAGAEGERVVRRLLGRALPVKGKGADFIIPGVRPQYVEVKATFGNRPKKQVILKTAGGEWINKLADHVIIVTNTHVYLADADKLRKHVAEHYYSFQKLPKRRRETAIRINVPISHLQEHGVVTGFSRERVNCIAREIRKMTQRKSLPLHAAIAKRGHLVAERRPLEALPRPPLHPLRMRMR
ncbi:hypothetical protein H0O03_05160 [Candidatus Micrarchaeota archaeon]|nr:hypothetical protein [Candidatus Micrarchaeota archaeon]